MESVEVTITSAKDLKNVNWRHGNLKPYAVAWVDPDAKRSTPVDDEGDTSPSWNHTLTVPFSSPVQDSILHIDIVHAGADDGTKPLVGSAKLPLRDVLDEGGRAERTLHLKRPSGRPQGKLEVTVSIPDRRYRAPDPYYAPAYGSVPRPEIRDYPAPQSGYPPYGAPPSGYPNYGAPPSGYPAYGAPPSGYPAYGAPPSGYPAYGAPPAPSGSYYAEEEKKKSKFGGMGTGLAVGAVGGVLGGLALAEGVDALEDNIADEAAERVEDDLGYDDGGDDY